MSNKMNKGLHILRFIETNSRTNDFKLKRAFTSRHQIRQGHNIAASKFEGMIVNRRWWIYLKTAFRNWNKSPEVDSKYRESKI